MTYGIKYYYYKLLTHLDKAGDAILSSKQSMDLRMTEQVEKAF